MDYSALISQELKLEAKRVSAALALFDDGCTVPFVARYRKDRTDALDEIQLRDIQHRYEYYKELAERKQTVISTIQEQGKMTPELLAQIEACVDCGKCMEKCPYELNIPVLLRKNYEDYKKVLAGEISVS